MRSSLTLPSGVLPAAVVADANILLLDFPIWSQDKDLAASGLTVYTTGQLLDALRDEAAVTDDNG